MFAFHKTWCLIQLDYGNDLFPKVMTYKKFKHAWYGFLSLLDVDISSGFMCPHCGSSPNIVICDGTSLAFRRQLLKSASVSPDNNDVPQFKGR